MSVGAHATEPSKSCACEGWYILRKEEPDNEDLFVVAWTTSSKIAELPWHKQEKDITIRH